MLKIRFITVGGTIDKVYFDAKSQYEVGPPNISKVLEELTLNIDYEVTSILRKDSLELTDSDRQKILLEVVKSSEEMIIITHGTDTMPLTARVLQEVTDKTVVLTGALEPAMFKTSDALFNIGGAIAAVQTLANGAYIVMNGQVFKGDNVRKDVEQSRFVELV